RGPSEKGSSQAQQNLISVPVDTPEAKGKIIDSFAEEDGSAPKKKKKIAIAIAAVGVVLAILAAVVFIPRGEEQKAVSQKPKFVGTPEAALKKSLLLYDLEGARDALSEFELE